LDRIGVAPSAIQLLVASGLHPPMPSSHLSNILPNDILNKYPVAVHDANRTDLAYLGETSRRTPVF
jgi:nickel-dependent lactate racemase